LHAICVDPDGHSYERQNQHGHQGIMMKLDNALAEIGWGESSGTTTLTRMMLVTILVAFIWSPTLGHARIYKHKDKDGKWVFTDAPERVEVG
jgi:hypothetical protein